MKKIYQTLTGLLICSAGLAQTTVTFTSTGTFIVPAGVTSIDVEVVGAGGDGSGNGGGGGGGGGYASGTYAVVPGASLTVNVGTHGGGTIGGGSSVGMFIAASGGSNGTSGGASPGGAGGVGTGGTINRTGGTGGNGTWTYFGGGGGGAAGPVSNGSTGGSTPPWTGICLQPGGSAGNGGGAPGGDGGKGSGFTDGSCVTNNPATPGLTYGGGGGGGNGNGGPSSPGANGYCVITYNSCSLDLTTSLSGTTITANATGVSYQWIDCSTGTPLAGETNASYSASSSGDYAVIIDDGTCSDTSACVTVTCTVDLTTSVTGFTITSNQAGATSYGWLNCATGTQIVGENSVSYTPSANGDYAVIVQVGSCIDTSACVNINGLGIDAGLSNMNLVVYPNPFTNRINVENENGTEYYELINAQGQLVWSGKNIETTNFDALPEAIYVLKIKRDEQTQFVSLVKK